MDGNKIIHPFDKIPELKADLPYTNTGMPGSKQALIPEYFIDESYVVNLLELSDGNEVEAIVYNADGSIYERYKLGDDELNNKTQTIWIKQ